MMLRGRFHAGRPSLRAGDRHVESSSTVDASGGGDAPCDEGDGECYRLISVDAVRAPEGCTGGDWHIYRIVQGKNGITGYRRGNLALVRTDVEAIVTALNGRRQWTTGKAPSKSHRRAAAAGRRAAAK